MNATTTATLPAAALVAALTLAACGGSSANPTASASHHPSAAAAATTNPSCQSQVDAWFSGGGNANLHAMAHDTGKISTDVPRAVAGLKSGDNSGLSTLTSDGSQLQADANSALSDPPPGCRSSGNHWYQLAMAEYAAAGTDLVTGSTDAQGGNYTGGAAAIVASNKALTKGNRDLAKATAAINNG